MLFHVKNSWKISRKSSSRPTVETVWVNWQLIFFPANHSDSSRSRTEAKYHLNFRIFKFSEKEGKVESGFSELVDFNLWEFESSNFWVWQFFGTTGATPGSDADRFRPPYQLPTYWKSNTRIQAQGNCFLIT